MKTYNINIYRFLAVLFIISIVSSSFAQRNRWKEHKFKDTTALSPVNEKYKNHDAVIIRNVKLMEFKGFIDYTIQKTSYNLIRINNDIGLQAYNKILIPMYGVLKIIDIQVRFISPTGKVTNLKRSDIREVKNLEGYGDFTVFAIKGAEVGGEIEYKYTLQMRPSFSHLEIYYNRYPIQEARFELVAPSGLRIFIRGYNGFPDFEEDTKGRQAWYAEIYDIDPNENEKNALNRSNRMKVAYGAYTFSQGEYSFWSKLREDKHSFLYRFSRGQNKIALEINKELNLDSLEVPQKIEAIRNFAMDSIRLIHSYYPTDFTVVLKQRTATSSMSKLKVMSTLFIVNNIKFESLWAADKYFAEYLTAYPFSFNQDRFLFYFPELDQFLDPFSRMYPLGIIPYEYINTEALFVKEHTQSIKKVLPADTSISRENVHLDVRIDSNWNTHIKSRFEITGYGAAEWRSFLTHFDKKDKKDLFEEFHSSHMLDLKMNTIDILNDSLDALSYPQPPLIFEFDMNSSMIIEKAGDDFVFNLGRLLRPSLDFYQEKERKQDIIMDYPSLIQTIIEIEIPKDYEVANPQILNQQMAYTDSSSLATYFYESSYAMDHNTLNFKIEECNTDCVYPVKDYVKIREVINAISDLSFLKLILSPKEVIDQTLLIE